MAGMIDYDQVKARLESRKSEIQTELEEIQRKLAALDLLTPELTMDGLQPSRIRIFNANPGELSDEHIDTIVRSIPGEFTYKDVHQDAMTRFGIISDPDVVRLALHRMTRGSDSPIEIVLPGSGRRPSTYKRKL